LPGLGIDGSTPLMLIQCTRDISSWFVYFCGYSLQRQSRVTACQNVTSFSSNRPG